MVLEFLPIVCIPNAKLLFLWYSSSFHLFAFNVIYMTFFSFWLNHCMDLSYAALAILHFSMLCQSSAYVASKHLLFANQKLTTLFIIICIMILISFQIDVGSHLAID